MHAFKASKPSQEEDPSKEWTLEPEHEFRFEVDFGSVVKIKLLKGTAEIFGTELAIGMSYDFTGRKVAVFSWHGCTLEVQGKCSVEYAANETPMTSYLNTHLAIEGLRQDAQDRGEQGPRVMIIGPSDVGKTSLCKILLSYGLRQGRQPIFVSLDTNEGSITMPGTLTATSITHIIDVEEGFGSSATTAASMGSSTMPLAYYFGHPSPAENVKLYRILMSRLAHSVKCRMAGDEEARVAGLIIDTTGLIDHVGYEIIQHAIEEFSVNVIIALGHERLYSDMVRILKDNTNVSVLKLAKSGGVVERDTVFRRQLQMNKIHEYFYGTPKCDLSPYNTFINFHDVSIYSVGNGSLAPSSALPLGMDRAVSETQLVKVDAGDILLHSVLAVSNAETAEDEAGLIETNLAGFIYISEVDEEKHKLNVMSPSPGRLPKRYLLLGSFKWMEG